MARAIEPTAAGSSRGMRDTASGERTGSAITGPVPATMSRSMPAALSGTTMSENRIAASTSCRRTGCMVISQTSSASKQDSSMP